MSVVGAYPSWCLWKSDRVTLTPICASFLENSLIPTQSPLRRTSSAQTTDGDWYRGRSERGTTKILPQLSGKDIDRFG